MDDATPSPVVGTRPGRWRRRVLVAAIAVIAFVLVTALMLQQSTSTPTISPRGNGLLLEPALHPVPILPSVSRVSPAAEPVVCDADGGSCVVVDTDRPAAVIAKLAKDLPLASGKRYRVQLSAVPVVVDGPEK